MCTLPDYIMGHEASVRLKDLRDYLKLFSINPRFSALPQRFRFRFSCLVAIRNKVKILLKNQVDNVFRIALKTVPPKDSIKRGPCDFIQNPIVRRYHHKWIYYYNYYMMNDIHTLYHFV